MFNKKICKKCNAKVSKKVSFCPNCGTYLNPYKKNSENKNSKKDFGILGQNDELVQPNENEIFANSMFSGFSGKMINKMLNSTMKMLEKEMQKDMKKMSQNQNTHFELFINGQRIDPRKIKVTQKPIQVQQIKKNSNKEMQKNFNSENFKNFSKFPITEPKSNLRRLSDKIIYEIFVPGVKKIENVSIIKAGNSIEVKAISDENSYKKIIPLNLNILKYDLNNEIISLELQSD